MEKDFFEFSTELRGYRIFNKAGIEIPKYILYWKGFKACQIKERFKLVSR